MVDRSSGAGEEMPTSWLFVFVGAAPRTEWLGEEIVRDRKGFIVTVRTCWPDVPAWSLPARAVRPRDQPARGLRGRRRPPRLDEAGRFGRR